MPDIDPYQGSPLLIGIPYEKWKELEDVMQDSDATRGGDVTTFAAIICLDAVSSYIENKKKERKKKATNQP